ncbi:MAG: sigma-70 family RNA polymerase sigma factor [Planctomycetaceae bacterium]|jgi:RNA polymerase sigma-70 factor (ECF subfamily)|nr:sigma-70 family RNA polymerase sigma factor [Planctomycetaceae bacterium]
MNYARKIDSRCFPYEYEMDQRTNINVENPVRLTTQPRFNTIVVDPRYVDENFANKITKNIDNRVPISATGNTANNTRKNLSDYSTYSDDMLLLEFRETRQRELFEELVRRYERELFNYIKNYVGDTGNAEDVFQLTFMQVYLKCDQFESGRKFRPWLYAIATNKSIDLLRVRRRLRKRFRLISIDDSGNDENGSTIRDTVESNQPDPLSDTINDEEAHRVRNAMQRLPENLRQTLYLIYFRGLPYREAAEVLGIPFGTVKSRLNQAINKLNSLLSKG